jgi:hypothetical protein
MTGDTIGAALGAREHQRARHLRVGKQLHQQRTLVVAFDVKHALRDAVDGRGRRRNSDPDRIAQHLVGQLADLGRHGRREEQVLALCRHLRNDAPDRRQEAQVQHPIGLVEHQDFRARQADVALADVVEKPARRGNQHVDAPCQCLNLGPVTDAAEHDRDREIEMPAVGAEALGDLGGKLAGGAEHEHSAALARAGRRSVASR